jgi:hypothetical protein
MKIIKNFLLKEDFLKLKNIFTSNNFPWFMAPVITNNFKHFQHFHIFYMNQQINSNYYDLMLPILKLIDPFIILRIKVNLIIRNEKIIEHGMHTDFGEKVKDCKITTGILYINSNNGYTKFENGKKILSEENKFIEFDEKLMHTGTSCTDEPFRIVINFNYIKRNENIRH